jgi:hypothetical protein
MKRLVFLKNILPNRNLTQASLLAITLRANITDNLNVTCFYKKYTIT